MNPYRFLRQLPDPDPGEVQEWVDSLDGLAEARGAGPRPSCAVARAGASRRARDRRSRGGRDRLRQHDPRRRGAAVPGRRGPRAAHPPLHPLERGGDGGPGQPPPRRHRRPPGHLRVGRHPLRGRASTTSSAARPTAPSATRCSSRATPHPGIYARAFLEGRLGEADLDRFRREVGGGLPSYPHPRRSDFWEFPTVSMGLGLINAAYQARFNRYLARSRHRRHQQREGVVLRRRRRDGRAREPGRPRAWPAGNDSTTSSSSSTATCSASTVPCAATARSSRSSKACSGAPAGT